MSKILIVTKDIVEFGLYERVVGLLKKHGHQITIIAEGLSLNKWVEAGENIYSGKPNEKYWDTVNGFRYDIEPQEVIKELKPDLVLAGIASPINLGEKFGIAANKNGIKLGCLVDLWGAERCFRAIPDFLCVIDPLAGKMVREYEGYYNKTPQVYITGSPLLDRLATINRNPDLEEILSTRRPVIFLVGQEESTQSAVDGLMEVLPKLGDKCLLIPRLHPKLMDCDFVPLCLRSLAKAPVEVLWVNSKVTTQEIMLSAHYTVSMFSNALIEAAVLGSFPISWTSDRARDRMRESMGGLERFPLVDYGCGIEVDSPKDFIKKIPVVDSANYIALLNRCKKIFPNDGKSATRVVRAIQKELEK